jgi:hypothetical protein
MIEVGILKNFDSETYKAGVQLAGSLTTYFDDISVAKNIPSGAMVIGNYVIVAIPGGNPRDACVIATWPGGTPGGGAGSFLELSDTPSSYSGQAGKSPVVNEAENALEFLARAKISQDDMTIYIDKDATGEGTGESWGNAFTSWADCKAYLTGWIIAHDWVIKVRKGSTPYRETFDLSGFTVWGTLTIEAEYYWQGNCQANATAGNIKDTSADFSNVEVGDKVYVLDLNGSGGKAQNYELCTVDDISQAGSGIIGTNGSKTATTGWIYVIVKTEISGSDNGTDGGTARAFCFEITSIDNTTIRGFYLTFSDDAGIVLTNARNCYSFYCILKDTDGGIYAVSHSSLGIQYCHIDAPVRFGVLSGQESYIDCRYSAVTAPTYYAVYGYRIGGLLFAYGYIFSSNVGVQPDDFSWIYLASVTISSGVTKGIVARYNSICKLSNVTNNASTPETPSGTSDHPYIGT